MSKKCGLVSISFRNKSTEEIIALCLRSGLKYIEWGSDVHCPVGDISHAEQLGIKTKNAGLTPYCYGSYFRVGITPVAEFSDYCVTAKALGAKCIRVWAYNKKYSDCSGNEISEIVRQAKEILDIAKKHDLLVNFEYHRGCLTENIDGALGLFNELDSDSLRVHWQPNPEITVEDNLYELSKLPRVDIIHVFAWTFENGENVRHPLFNHHMSWKEYITIAKEKNPDCVFELEFFMNDSDAQCIDDAKVLADIC